MLALSTDSLKGYGLNRIFYFAKEAGFDGVDLEVDLKLFDTKNTEYVRSLIKQFDLPVLSITAPPTASSKKIKDIVDMAKELNSKVIIIEPPKLLNFKYIGWLRKEIPKIRQKEHISIALTNAPSRAFLGIFPEHAMGNIAEQKKFKHACIDTSRVADKKEDLIRIYRILKKYVVHIHLSNIYRGKKYNLPDEGVLPLESFLTKLQQDDYPGNISIKVLPKFLKAGNDEKVLKTLKEVKKFYDSYFVKKKGNPGTTEAA